MTTDDPTEALAAKAVETVREAYQAGYQAGYQAAVANMMHAVQHHNLARPPSRQELAPSDAAIGTVQTSNIGTAQQPGQTQQAASPLSAYEAMPKTASGRAAPGSIKRLVYEFVSTAGRPITENDFAARYHDIGRPSRYMAFRSLHSDGVIAKQGRSWVLASKDARNPDADTSGLSQPDQGGTGNAPA